MTALVYENDCHSVGQCTYMAICFAAYSLLLSVTDAASPALNGRLLMRA